MTNENQEILKFVPFNSCINPSFWYELNRLKLDEYMLNDDFKNLTGFFSNCTNNDLPPIMNFDYNSFSMNESDAALSKRDICVNGTLKVFNTINEFNQLDKNKLLDELGAKIWSDITSGKAIDSPELLIKFCLITFANLKSYVFHYWFAFPSLTFTNKPYNLKKCTKFTDAFSNEQSEKFLANLSIFNAKKSIQPSFYAINYDNLDIISVKEGISFYNDSNRRVVFVFNDPNSQSTFPGWILRNFLALLSLNCKSQTNTLEVLSFRDRYKNGSRTVEHSLLFEIGLNDVTTTSPVTIVGWERNEKNNLMPRIVDMSGTMNTEKLAESAVSLNLKLMKWRIAPNIDLEIIKNKKCLLLGSGTLGCNVARTLMAWGVNTITFVDNSKVSFSNPVRQSLFVFEDSIAGPSKDNYKANRAAENLRKIYPGVNTKGIILNIPMPGHYVNDSVKSRIQQDVEQLEQLIKEHDCIFLLMDTRESRWLPTLISAANGKLVINSALGFDSFLVMRHGVKNLRNQTDIKLNDTTYQGNTRIASENLGCYFCNDIVAPGNSTLDRTLDQQCTVSRPGLSMVASALSVELMVTILQHPLKENAPSYTNGNADIDYDSNESCLGMVPHQLRGYLHSYSIISPASQAFDKCTACSKSIIDMYKTEGFNFLVKVFNDSTYLEDITGLKELKTALDENETDFVTELSDSESI